MTHTATLLVLGLLATTSYGRAATASSKTTYEVSVDLDGDDQPEKVAYDSAGLATYSSAGKLSAIVREVPDLIPGESAGFPTRKLSWEKWSWGKADAVVITDMTCGSHCYTDAWVIYQGPLPSPVVELVSQSGRGVELEDVDGDGFKDLLVWQDEIVDPKLSSNVTKISPSQPSWFGGAVEQGCVSEADKRPLPYVFTLGTVGGAFRCKPLSLSDSRFRGAHDVMEEWITTLSVLVQRTKAQYRREMKGRALLTSAAVKCNDEIRAIEGILAQLLD